jgi:hypothetical protein
VYIFLVPFVINQYSTTYVNEQAAITDRPIFHLSVYVTYILYYCRRVYGNGPSYRAASKGLYIPLCSFTQTPIILEANIRKKTVCIFIVCCLRREKYVKRVRGVWCVETTVGHASLLSETNGLADEWTPLP